MIYKLEIEEGKEKPVINFLKQLDFVTVSVIKKASKSGAKTTPLQHNDLSYFDTCPTWDMDVKSMRKKDIKKRIKGWL
jgi:hypothetical protein